MSNIEDIREAAVKRLESARLAYEAEEQAVLKINQGLDELERAGDKYTTANKDALLRRIASSAGVKSFTGEHRAK